MDSTGERWLKTMLKKTKHNMFVLGFILATALGLGMVHYIMQPTLALLLAKEERVEIIYDSLREDVQLKNSNVGVQHDEAVVDISVDGMAIVSAYNADPAQTDSTPTVMASGKTVFEGSVANNCLEFGTKVKIGNEVYEVQDRMNSRYSCEHFDIFLWDYNEAIAYGRKEVPYKVL
jgi:3D (Asp-Asp-Asp) domain-containing protein